MTWKPCSKSESSPYSFLAWYVRIRPYPMICTFVCVCVCVRARAHVHFAMGVVRLVGRDTLPLLSLPPTPPLSPSLSVPSV